MADLDDIKARVSCPMALEMLDVPGPDRTGKIPCFGHEEDTPSLHVWEDHWRAFCCGQGGDVFDLVKFATGCSTSKAIAFLEGAADGLEATVRQTQEEARELRDFGDRLATESRMAVMHDEGIDGAFRLLIEKWPHLSIPFLSEAGVVAGPYHLLIPHYDDEGVVRGVKTRATVGGDVGKKGAWTGSNFTTRLYRHTDWGGADVGPPVVVLTEGESDCWTATKALGNRAQVLALPSGVNAIKPHFIDELAAYDRVILALDSDDQGRQATQTIIGALNARGHTAVGSFNPGPYKDITEWELSGPPGLLLTLGL